MKPALDAYWDELGVAWCAIDPKPDVLMPHLESRLRRQSAVITAGLVLGLPLCTAGALLGVVTIWSGWATNTWNFVTRGIAIVAISALQGIALWSLLRVRASDDAKALSEMLDLAIARGERALMAIRCGLYACAVAAVLGVAGAAIRTHLAGPPRLPLLIDLAALAIFALALFLATRRARINLAKYRYLKHATRPSGSTEG